MEVVENKNAPGNGLTDTVAPGENDPLKPPKPTEKPKKQDKPKKDKSSSNSKKKKWNEKDKKVRESGVGVVKMSDLDEDADDPGPSVSDTENDPENRRHRRQRKDLLGSWAHKARLTPKRGLIYILFCATVIVVLLFILFLLAALWPSGPSYDPCLTSNCHLYSSQISGGLNQTRSACDDYWEFSCGGWLHAHPLPKSTAYWDVSAQHQFEVKETLRTLLNTLPADTDERNRLPLKMKQFYDSCMGTDYIEADGEKGLIRIINALGGWYALRNFRSNDFDFPRLLRKLQGEYRTSPFFHISVVPDPNVPSRNIIKIIPSGLSLPHRSYYFEQNDPMSNAFQSFAKDVVKLLGATSYDGSQFAVEIFNFEKRLAEVTPDPRNLTDPVQSYHKLTVSELKAMSNTIFWGDLLQALFPHGNVNDQTQVVTPSVQYLMDVSGVISTTDKANLNNYLMWQLTQKYLPYLSRQYTEALEMFRKESIGSSLGTHRWEFCITETIRFYPHGVDFLLAQSGRPGLDADHRITTITDMFERMRQTLIDRVNSATKFDESIRNFLLDKLRLMTIHVGNPIGNKTQLEELYYSVQMQKFEFFTNVHRLIEFQSALSQKDLAHPRKDTAIINAFANSPFKIQFLPSLNKVVVPQTVLHRDVLNVQESMLPLLYGSIGVEIAEAMASAFGPEQGLYFANGALMPERDAKVQELRDIIDSRRTCLASFFTNIRLDDEPYIERTSLDTTIHLAGVQIALDTLRTHDLSDGFLSLPGLDYSPEGTFFLSYGQSQCSVHTMLFHDLEHTTFTSLSHDHRVRGILRQMVSFTEAFGCSKSSEMYADFSCGNII